MTEQKRLAKEWEHGVIKADAQVSGEHEFDIIDAFQSVPRVIHLISLGYKITNWQEYFQAELNEMGK